ncbi:E3 ubiquitin-protein ligase TRIM65 [Alosa pseudoharengus]|uniref:E3 ubiquitin-protein ligase TRIM65 n=1 Tax=Alosa pseudoharengus TaxID=34774 RepID=UPI003F88746A
MESDNLCCAICIEKFRVPVTIPCGHTFCQKCISKLWDTKEEKGIVTQCPLCNEEFPTRPALKRNYSLSLLTEATESVSRELPSVSRTDRPDPELELCGQHDKPLVIYCKTEGRCVCYECAITACKNHEQVLVEKERRSREAGLKKKAVEIKKHMEETEKNIVKLRENIANAKVSYQQTAQWMDLRFCDLLKVLQEKQEVTQSYLAQEQDTALTQAQERLEELQERSQRLQQSHEQIAEVNTLPHSRLIQESRLVEVPQMQDVPVDVNVNLQDRLAGVTDILTRVSKLVLEDLVKAMDTAIGQDKQGSPQDKKPTLAVVPSPATPSYPGGREGLSEYRCSLTFDPRTANSHLQLSLSNRRAEHLTTGPRPVPVDKARFDHTWQVLCHEGFHRGRHYWELEVSKPWAYLGVTYQAIPRKEKGKQCMVGMNELSWSLQLDERQLSAWHAGRRETVAAATHHPPHQALRIGMLLDYEAGTLTYYGEGQARLHAFHCVFTQELFPACWIGEGVSVTLCPP